MKKQNYNWISEEKACELLGYKKSSLRILTRTVKSLPIRTTKPNYRTVLYSGVDIDAYIDSKATA